VGSLKDDKKRRKKIKQRQAASDKTSKVIAKGKKAKKR
jgi:hypothetical protein